MKTETKLNCDFMFMFVSSVKYTMWSMLNIQYETDMILTCVCSFFYDKL